MALVAITFMTISGLPRVRCVAIVGLYLLTIPTVLPRRGGFYRNLRCTVTAVLPL